MTYYGPFSQHNYAYRSIFWGLIFHSRQMWSSKKSRQTSNFLILILLLHSVIPSKPKNWKWVTTTKMYQVFVGFFNSIFYVDNTNLIKSFWSIQWSVVLVILDIWLVIWNVVDDQGSRENLKGEKIGSFFKTIFVSLFNDRTWQNFDLSKCHTGKCARAQASMLRMKLMP